MRKVLCIVQSQATPFTHNKIVYCQIHDPFGNNIPSERDEICTRDIGVTLSRRLNVHCEVCSEWSGTLFMLGVVKYTHYSTRYIYVGLSFTFVIVLKTAVKFSHYTINILSRISIEINPWTRRFNWLFAPHVRSHFHGTTAIANAVKKCRVTSTRSNRKGRNTPLTIQHIMTSYQNIVILLYFVLIPFKLYHKRLPKRTDYLAIWRKYLYKEITTA